MNKPQNGKGECVDWEDFVPKSNPKEMQSMVDSLLDSATKQR
eukprot:CAMPEP_0183737000 /NCGR_PEP_ID=MMETSP0737-20130205/50819_1 /TAXON_ID=385413 /ORGANISM="Thalassiosira miniscula, Strain CCMP1093" /LENGTH=41 /DNA_ID= /DNA_START= /DNA_END= /DNA_ORIENTATION=